MSNIHTCSYSCDRPECIKAQRDELAAAAAQEAVGWQWRWLDTDNTWSEWVDGGSRKETDARIARWKADGEDHRMQVRPVFAAPVTAAPVYCRDVRSAIAGLEGSVAVGSDGEWVSVRRAARDAAVMALRNVSLDCAHIYAAYSEAKASTPAAPAKCPACASATESYCCNYGWASASTPAAPGIDLRNAILQLREDALHMKDHGDTVNAYNRVLALIDTSHKGATLNEQFGSAEGLGGSEAQAAELKANQDAGNGEVVS